MVQLPFPGMCFNFFFSRVKSDEEKRMLVFKKKKKNQKTKKWTQTNQKTPKFLKHQNPNSTNKLLYLLGPC